MRLGPLAGATSGGPTLLEWVFVYLCVVGGAALATFARKDL